MILSKFIPESAPSFSQAGSQSGKTQADAQSQFDDVMAHVPKARSGSSGSGAAGPNGAADPAVPAPASSPFGATTFFTAMSKTQTSDASPATDSAGGIGPVSDGAEPAIPTTLPSGAPSFFTAMSKTQTSDASSATGSAGGIGPVNAGAEPAIPTPTALPSGATFFLTAMSKTQTPTASPATGAVSGSKAPTTVPSTTGLATAPGKLGSGSVPQTAAIQEQHSPGSPPKPAPTAILVPATSATDAAAIPAQSQVSVATAPSGLDQMLVALAAKTPAAPADGFAKAGSSIVSPIRNRGDSKDSKAANADLVPKTEGSAVADAPTPSLTSSLLGLLPAPLSQAQAAPPNASSRSAVAAKTQGGAMAGPLVGASGSTLQAAAGGTGLSASKELLGGGAPVSPLSPEGTASKTPASAPNVLSIVKSVSVEAQLTPGPTLSPMQQVIDTVQRLAGETTAVSAPPASVVAPPTAPVIAGRAVTLVLEPENMGTVTVRMQLRGNSLDLQLDVANPETLGLLTRDKDNLTTAMSGQDYQIGTLTMRASDSQSASQGQDNGTQHQDQRNGGFPSGGGGTSPEGRSANQGENGYSSSGGGSGGERAARPRAADLGDDPAPRLRSLSSDGSAGVYI